MSETTILWSIIVWFYVTGVFSSISMFGIMKDRSRLIKDGVRLNKVVVFLYSLFFPVSMIVIATGIFIRIMVSEER